jgi:AbrB family looped-hinge helix DNA binding protein
MPKVTSKLQLTLPKAIAEQFKIRPGDEVDWVVAGDAIRLVPVKSLPREVDVRARLQLFDQATARQEARDARPRPAVSRARAADRGWRREDLYDRGQSH